MPRRGYRGRPKGVLRAENKSDSLSPVRVRRGRAREIVNHPGSR
jgi:hypothetical protein